MSREAYQLPAKKERVSFFLKRRFLLAFLVVVAVVEALLSISLFAVYSYSQLQSARRSSIAQLRQVSSSADILHEQVANVQNSIYSDGDIYKTMVSRRINRLEEAQAVRKLRSIQSSHPYIRFTGVYNPHLFRYITNAGVFTEEEFIKEELLAPLGDNQKISVPRVIGVPYPLSTTKASVYTFLFRPKAWNEVQHNAMVTVDISQDYLYDLICNIAGEETDRQIIVLDENGIIIAHTDRKLFMKGSDELFFSQALVQEQDEAGSLLLRDEGNRSQLITFVRSPNTAWTFVSVQARDSILQDTLWLASITVIMALLLFGIGLAISYQMSQQLHDPIRKLVEKYETGQPSGKRINELHVLGEAFSRAVNRATTLESNLAASLGASKHTCVRFLLEGNLAYINQSRPIYERLGINLEARGFLPVLIEYTQPKPDEIVPSDLPLYHYALENIATELLSELCPVSFLYMGETRFAVLLYLMEEEAPASLKDTLHQLAIIMEREFHLQVTSCVGAVVGTWEQISASYDRTVVALNQRLAMEHRDVLYSSELLSNLVVKQYPKGLQNRFGEYIRTGDRAQADAATGELMDFLGDVSWVYAQNYCKHIMLFLLGEFDSYLDMTGEALRTAFEKIEEINGCQTLGDIERAFAAFTDSLLALMEERRKSGNHSKAVKQAQEYIALHYADPNISMNSLAAVVELSPAYLGKLFSSATATSLPDYLNSVRLEHAARLLEETDQPIGQISEAVGILNTNYFYTVFKKKYAVTPASYRRSVRRDRGKSPAETNR